MDTASGRNYRLAHLAPTSLAVIAAALMVSAMALLAAIVLIDALQLLASEPISLAPIRWW